MIEPDLPILSQCFDYSPPPGWAEILDATLAHLAKVDPDCKVVQVKSKFGSLCIYTNGHNEKAEFVIKQAVKVAAKTCEVSGELGELRNIGGWYITLSDAQYELKLKERAGRG